ncbi:MAG TPA: cupin domain-containing protein, partial [Nitrospira sp.]
MMTIVSGGTLVTRTVRWMVAGATVLVMAAATAWAEDPTSILMKQSLPDMPGKVLTVLTVYYTPGTASDPHVHPGSVVAYVLEGSIVSQLEGEKSVTYNKGQSWYEPPKQPHLVSKNASDEEPAKILVFLLSEEGESIKMPVSLG